MRMQLLQIQICSVCEQQVDNAPTDVVLGAMLEGVDEYGICPCCKQPVEPPYSRLYKERFEGFNINNK